MSLVSFQDDQLQAPLKNVFHRSLVSLINHFSKWQNPELINTRANEFFVVNERFVIQIDFWQTLWNHLSDAFPKLLRRRVTKLLEIKVSNSLEELFLHKVNMELYHFLADVSSEGADKRRHYWVLNPNTWENWVRL